MGVLLLTILLVLGGQPDEAPYVVYSGSDVGRKDLFIKFNLEKTQSVQFELFDLLGRQVTDHKWSAVLDQTFTIEVPEASDKVYIVRVAIDNKYYTNKIYINNSCGQVY
jgi:hypothetical protein